MNIFIQIITLANIFATVHVSTKHEKDGEKKNTTETRTIAYSVSEMFSKLFSAEKGCVLMKKNSKLFMQTEGDFFYFRWLI